MNIKKMLENHLDQMECDIIRLQSEIETLRTRKETIQQEMIRLKSKLAAIPKERAMLRLRVEMNKFQNFIGQPIDC